MNGCRSLGRLPGALHRPCPLVLQTIRLSHLEPATVLSLVSLLLSAANMSDCQVASLSHSSWEEDTINIMRLNPVMPAGPVNIHERVRRAMMVPGQNHRDPWFSPFFSKILEDVRMIFCTKSAQTFIYPGTGTGELHFGSLAPAFIMKLEAHCDKIGEEIRKDS